MQLNAQQKQAREQILDWAAKHPRIMSLQGPAGTGKTTLLGEILPELSKRFRKVTFTGMTGKAALRLRDVAKADTSTLHKALYEPPEGDQQQVSFDYVASAPGGVLVVDEASMVTPEILEDLLSWVDSGTAVLLVGDGYQLPPVMSPQEAKLHGDSYSVFSQVPGAHLTQVMRNGDDILDVATALRVEQQMTRKSRGAYTYVAGKRAIDVASDRAQAVLEGRDSALITWRNVTRMTLNSHVRDHLGMRGDPNPGEPIMFCKNGYGVLNGEIGTLSELVEAFMLGPVKTHRLKLRENVRVNALVTLGGKEERLDGQQAFLRDDDWRAFVADKRAMKLRGDPIPITWGYVLTAHKAQGSEFDEVTVYLEGADGAAKAFSAPSILPDGTKVPFWCRFLYTALTRAKKAATLVIGR